MTLLPIARPLRAPDKRAWQTLLFLTGDLRDHGVDDAALVSGLHRRHRLPHPGAGLGAGRARAAARARVGEPRRGRRRRGGGVAARGGARPSPGGPVRRPPLHEDDPLPPGRRAARRPTNSPTASTTSGSASPARARSSSASTASTARDLGNDVQYIGVPGPERDLPAADQLPRSSAARSTPATTTT